jgi:protein-disulfide isomerase
MIRVIVESYKYRPQVVKDLQDAQAAGVRGTPSFLINGKLVVGAQPFSVFQQEIEAALASVGSD